MLFKYMRKVITLETMSNKDNILYLAVKRGFIDDFVKVFIYLVWFVGLLGFMAYQPL